jgi:hypothetical protein
MLVIREVMQCKPGKVRELVKKCNALGEAMKRLGYKPFRVLTDVAGEPFWTMVLESEVESLNHFLEMEEKVMTDAEARQSMSGYHDLVVAGRREIYRLES